MIDEALAKGGRRVCDGSATLTPTGCSQPPLGLSPEGRLPPMMYADSSCVQPVLTAAKIMPLNGESPRASIENLSHADSDDFVEDIRSSAVANAHPDREVHAIFYSSARSHFIFTQEFRLRIY